MQEIDRVSKQQKKLLEGPESAAQRKVRENKEKREKETREKKEREAEIGTADLADVSGSAILFLHILTTVTERSHFRHSKAEEQGQGRDCSEESCCCRQYDEAWQERRKEWKEEEFGRRIY